MNVNFKPQPIMIAADNYFCAQIHYLLSDLANSYVSEGIDERLISRRCAGAEVPAHKLTITPGLFVVSL
jgi:hypothetical protein